MKANYFEVIYCFVIYFTTFIIFEKITIIKKADSVTLSAFFIFCPSIAIPFDLLGVEKNETVEFFLANTDSGVKNTHIPQEILLSLTRN